ncbi:MAG: phage terminase large subunit [Candidatus Thiodiazotropha endolucinida]
MADYYSSPTLKQFHKSDDFMRGVMGPIGSGKSSAMVCELFRRANEQAPNSGGVRCSRWVIIRNTYRELSDTTVRTFFDWIEERIGKWNSQEMSFHIKNDQMDAEFLFRALDRPGDVKKLKSLELTGGWVNEAVEVPRAVIDMLQGRVGRYPAQRDGGPTWSGVMLDTNPPDIDHWWYQLFEEKRPEGWSIYKQPSALCLEAENLNNLPPEYYKRLLQGKSDQWVDVYVHGKYGFVSDGKPVYPEFNDNIHVASEILEPDANEPLYVGLDFGLTPAAVITQRLGTGRWVVLEEIATEEMGAVRFSEILGRKLRENYAGYGVRTTGDPAGDQRAQTDEKTPFDILNANGISAQPADTNDFVLRRETVAKHLTTLTMDGKPSLLISPNCLMLRKGMGGGYYYKRIQVAGDERYRDAPDKGRFSHVCEALQYCMLGAGEGNELIRKKYPGRRRPLEYPHLGLGYG